MAKAIFKLSSFIVYPLNDKGGIVNKQLEIFKLRFVFIEGIPYFKEGLAVLVQRRNIPTTFTTWFQVGRELFDKNLRLQTVLPSVLLRELQTSLESMNEDMTTYILILIGDFMAGWLSNEEQEG